MRPDTTAVGDALSPWTMVRELWGVLVALGAGALALTRWAVGVNARLATVENATKAFQTALDTKATHADVLAATAAVEKLGTELKAEFIYLRRRIDQLHDQAGE